MPGRAPPASASRPREMTARTAVASRHGEDERVVAFSTPSRRADGLDDDALLVGQRSTVWMPRTQPEMVGAHDCSTTRRRTRRTERRRDRIRARASRAGSTSTAVGEAHVGRLRAGHVLEQDAVRAVDPVGRGEPHPGASRATQMRRRARVVSPLGPVRATIGMPPRRLAGRACRRTDGIVPRRPLLRAVCIRIPGDALTSMITAPLSATNGTPMSRSARRPPRRPASPPRRPRRRRRRVVKG
jgi:hypothetical protein